jgi:hypothetical protein
MEARAHPARAGTGELTRRVLARAWFEREPEEMVWTQMTRVARPCDQTLMLLHLPAAERVWQRQDDKEAGGWMPGQRIGRPLVRNLNPTKQGPVARPLPPPRTPWRVRRARAARDPRRGDEEDD